MYGPPSFDGAPSRHFTEVAVRTLSNAIGATQAIRHARDVGEETAASLTEEHLAALAALDRHPALRTLTQERIDRYEQSVADADAIERERAERFLEALGEPERARRARRDYVAEYRWVSKDDSCEVEDCPVCGCTALVTPERERILDEVGVGHCFVCSYERTARVAQDQRRRCSSSGRWSARTDRPAGRTSAPRVDLLRRGAGRSHRTT
ncbi:hypothetical protein [Actinomadura napierensis]|uniref:Uncharacterized protein n=1 Tax=Actinomadura napierensis TaxID=267854 RepID=A0ABP5MEC4_9ACTN